MKDSAVCPFVIFLLFFTELGIIGKLAVRCANVKHWHFFLIALGAGWSQKQPQELLPRPSIKG